MSRTKKEKESTLLVASPKYCNAGTTKFNIWPRIIHLYTSKGHCKNIKIIFLNCVDKHAIADYMKALVTELKHAPQELRLMHHIAFFEKTLKKLAHKKSATLHDELRSSTEKIVGPACTDDNNTIFVP